MNQHMPEKPMSQTRIKTIPNDMETQHINTYEIQQKLF